MQRNQDQVFDELLVIQCQSGDRKALALLVKRWNVKMLRQAYYHINEMQPTRDIVQESWHDIISGLQKLRDPAAFPGWVRRIVYGKSVDWIRQKQKQRNINKNEKEELQAERQIVDSSNEDQIKTLRWALKKLTNEQRYILTLHYLDNQPIQEISHVLSIPEGTVKSRLFHARKSLLKHFKRIKKQEV